MYYWTIEVEYFLQALMIGICSGNEGLCVRFDSKWQFEPRGTTRFTLSPQDPGVKRVVFKSIPVEFDRNQRSFMLLLKLNKILE
uniref:Uncharacterized protein n=1 Tax=Acrobeloides nanus TaxID=290746 RepID=A0A914D3U4_9BILA